MRKLIGYLMLIYASAITGSASAHHSFAAEFSYEDFGTREGEIIEVHFVNPHARIFFSVTNESGEEEIWDGQTVAPRALISNGWNKDTIKVGDHISIDGNLGLEGSLKIWIVSMTLNGTTVIYPDGGGVN